MKIPFNIPCVWGDEFAYIQKAITKKKFSGKGEFVQKCSRLIKNITNAKKIYLTPSCTSALEMSSLLLDIQAGDEIILPAFTHIATANPFVHSSAKIVWCDIREDTKNLDEEMLADLITKRTKAIVAVHYGGVACNMDKIVNICNKNDIFLIEDAAMAIGAKFRDKPLGSYGDLAVISFHETKNIQCGEGGALLINNPELFEKATVLYNRGTDRKQFEAGKKQEYTWIMSSSNFLMPELSAAFLFTQLNHQKEIQQKRLINWGAYFTDLSEFLPGRMLPIIPKLAEPNGHMFYLVLSTEEERKELINYLQAKNIQAVFHYIPLHHAPFWQGRYSPLHLPNTEMISKRILRLPLYFGLPVEEIKKIVHHIAEYFKKR